MTDIVELLEGRIARLRRAIDAATNVGVYPAAAIAGAKQYEKRTEYMQGWNDATRAALREAAACLHPGDWEDA